MENCNENPSVARFRDYLRIETVQPNPDYASAVEFLRNQAKEVCLKCEVVEYEPGMPIVLMTWPGLQEDLPTVLLNSHIDVVPVFKESWTHPPFSAFKDEDGNIFARGSQDMKCVGMQYLEAIRILKKNTIKLRRTIHLSFVPDEEIGGDKGLKWFVTTERFKKLNIGFALDEGLANPTENFTLFYGERMPWWLKVTCPGSPGHGSRFVENSAAEKFRKVVNAFLTFREEEEQRLKNDPNLMLGDVTTTNMTIVQGGVQVNVIPAELTAYFDMRVTPTVDLDALEARLRKMCADAGEGVTLTFVQQMINKKLTSIDPSDPWFAAFSAACKKHDVNLKPEIFPAATDSRFLRAIDIPALGFSPMNRTPILLHDHNEFLNERIFLRGIDIYVDIIQNIANVAAF